MKYDVSKIRNLLSDKMLWIKIKLATWFPQEFMLKTTINRTVSFTTIDINKNVLKNSKIICVLILLTFPGEFHKKQD